MHNVILGKTNDDCVEALIERLKKNYFENKNKIHLVIVPDRVTVLTEIKIFERLKLESACNIRVMTLSRLSSILVENINLISKASSCMLFQKLLKQNKDNLKCFNKRQEAELATILYKTISQFKSCKISPSEVFVTNKNQILSDKLSDLSLLYSKYLEHLKENNLLDSSDRLDLVVENAKNNDLIKNSFIYVGYFDSFTSQGYALINQLLKNCIEFNICVPSSFNSLNEHIYDDNFKSNILRLFESNSINPNLIFAPNTLTGQFKYIEEKLFSFNILPLKIEKSSIELFEGKTFEEELYFCCSNIKNLIENESYKFSDIVVAVCNLEKNKKLVEKIFEEYNFNYYIDASTIFSKNILVKLIDSLVNLSIENFSKTSVLSFIKNPLLKLDYKAIEDFEDYILKYNLNNFYEIKNSNFKNSKFYENFNLIRNSLYILTDCFLNEINISKTYNDFINAFENFLIRFNISQTLFDYAITFTKNGNSKQAKLFEQYFSILQNVFDDLKKVLGEEECDLKLFYSTLLSGFNSTKVSTPPISTNSLFVGDSSVSFFDRAKVYFIINADEENFPFTLNDVGIISDKEIEELSEHYKLEPSISNINKKERFKAYELVLKAKEKLFLSYNFSNSYKSKILDDISKMFIITGNNNNFYTLPFKDYSFQNFLVINNTYRVAKNNLITGIREVCDGNRPIDKDLKILYNAINCEEENLSEKKEDNFKFKNETNLDNLSNNFKFKRDNLEREKQKIDLNLFNFKNRVKLTQNNFFKNNKVSASQIESFMTCPFLHFSRYALKLKEKELSDLNNLNIGLLMHDVAREFVDNNELPIKDELVNELATKSFKTVIEKEVFEAVKNNPENKILLDNLLNETKRFCRVLNYQARNSNFKKLGTEVRFDEKSKIKGLILKVSNKNLLLIGQVDRIDSYKDYFRIIDYKTGKCDTFFKELYFGKKLQLEAYLKVLKESLNLKPAGAYYLPIKSSLSSEKESYEKKYQLKGRTLDDEELIIASDNRLSENLTSDIVEIKYLKNDKTEKKLSGYSKVISSSQLENVCEYAKNLISKACEDILKLDITPSPLVLSSSDNPCTNCSFFGLCRFSEQLSNVSRQPKNKIDLNDFK